MNYQLTQEEKDEIFDDRVAAYNEGYISEDIFRKEMAGIGKTASDIEELVKFYRPPETEDGDSS